MHQALRTPEAGILAGLVKEAKAATKSLAPTDKPLCLISDLSTAVPTPGPEEHAVSQKWIKNPEAQLVLAK